MYSHEHNVDCLLIKTGISDLINITDWDKWNMNSSCPTNYSASYVEIGCSFNINQKSEFSLSATFVCSSNVM